MIIDVYVYFSLLQLTILSPSSGPSTDTTIRLLLTPGERSYSVYITRCGLSFSIHDHHHHHHHHHHRHHHHGAKRYSTEKSYLEIVKRYSQVMCLFYSSNMDCNDNKLAHLSHG